MSLLCFGLRPYCCLLIGIRFVSIYSSHVFLVSYAVLLMSNKSSCTPWYTSSRTGNRGKMF